MYQQRELFCVTPEDQWDRNAESYKVFRKLWENNRITFGTTYRRPLVDAEVWPHPFQKPIRVWHGRATSKESVDVAARYGDPLFDEYRPVYATYLQFQKRLGVTPLATG